jgi:thioredoxin reductase (NADPH)
MSKATILTVDDDPMVLRAITRDLRARYGSDFRIVKAESGTQALAVLSELALRLRPVALIATDQRMPDMTGTEMLRQARQHAPDAKLLLLTAYADTDVAIKAINDIGLDYYLLKPWDPRPNGCTRSSTTCSATGSGRIPRRPGRCGWSTTGGRRAGTRSRHF